MKRIVRHIIGVLLLVTVFASCKKEYYLDSGIHDPNFNGTIVDYLNTRPEYFDTLVNIIEFAGLTDELSNEEVTFFAPPNGSISKSVRSLNRYLLNDGKDTVSDYKQIKAEVWRELLGLYIFKDKYSLKDVPQLDTMDIEAYPGQSYESLSGRPMIMGVIYANAGGVKYAGYRQLWFSYINDFSKPKTERINIPVATSNIAPINGFLHVLAFKYHNFGFSNSNFILKATSKGIDPAQ